jgi:hypothetical protein
MLDRDLDIPEGVASEPDDLNRQDNLRSPPEAPSTTGDPKRTPPYLVSQDRLRRDCKRLRRQRSQGY